jgi:hypothetical protein
VKVVRGDEFERERSVGSTITAGIFSVQGGGEYQVR